MHISSSLHRRASFARWLGRAAALVVLLLGASPARAELAVVTTTGDLAAVALAVGKERVRVRALAQPTQDPHWVDARPNLALELSNADLLLSVGAELEVGWLPTLQLGSRNAKIQKGSRGYLDCSELVELLDKPTTKVDRSMGDIHPSGSPHYMLDPRAAERVAVGIGKRLAELDPEGRARYLDNTKQFVTELRDARKRWEAALKTRRGRPVLAFHRSLGYLADWLGLVIVDHVEPKPGIPPNPRHVADLIRHARERGARVVLQEAYYPTNTSEIVAKKIGGKLIQLPGATNFSAGQTYVAFIEQIVKLLGGVP
jgi:zinc/manganese transport system substrate-binding protein